MISVVIPTLDEAPRIGALVRGLERAGIENIAVDLGRRDATPLWPAQTALSFSHRKRDACDRSGAGASTRMGI